MSQIVDMAEARKWIGRTEMAEEVLAPFRVQGLAALLNRAHTPLILPPLWHWLYFNPTVRQAEIGVDGHPKRGGFLPPVTFPRRMWAGGYIRFLAPLHIGTQVKRETLIRDVTLKKGKRGDFLLLSLEHRLLTGDEPAIEERQDLVYRPIEHAVRPVSKTTITEVGTADISDQWQPDAVQLFRYSALTFNAHRIHYDTRYAEQIEGYPGLIVHAPLTATVLLERFVKHIGEPLVEFTFRAVSPLIADRAVKLGCRCHVPGSYEMWATSEDGQVSMTATARTQKGCA